MWIAQRSQRQRNGEGAPIARAHCPPRTAPPCAVTIWWTIESPMPVPVKPSAFARATAERTSSKMALSLCCRNSNAFVADANQQPAVLAIDGDRAPRRFVRRVLDGIVEAGSTARSSARRDRRPPAARSPLMSRSTRMPRPVYSYLEFLDHGPDQRARIQRLEAIGRSTRPRGGRNPAGSPPACAGNPSDVRAVVRASARVVGDALVNKNLRQLPQ